MVQGGGEARVLGWRRERRRGREARRHASELSVRLGCQMLSSLARSLSGARIRRLAFGAFASLASLASLAGCADPEGEFDAFGDRVRQAEGSGGGGGSGGGAECTPPAPGEIDGDYLVALSARIKKPAPIVFLTKVETVDQGGQLALTLTFQPLSAADRKTPVGEPTGPLGPYLVAADGSFTLDLGPVFVPGEANPITGSDIEADADMMGKLCAPADFVCGEVTGVARASIELTLDGGSTFTFQKVTDPASLPPPVIGCEKSPAAPLE